MSDKPKFSPALIAALEHYGQVRYDWRQPHLFRHTDDKGHQADWPLERACLMAAKALDTEDFAILKLKALQAGLKKEGMERLYEHIMGEPLP